MPLDSQSLREVLDDLVARESSVSGLVIDLLYTSDLQISSHTALRDFSLRLPDILMPAPKLNSPASLP